MRKNCLEILRSFLYEESFIETYLVFFSYIFPYDEESIVGFP